MALVSTDVELAIEALQNAFDRHKESMPDIMEGPTVLGVQDLGDSGIALRIWATAQPMQQWSLERQLKLLVKKTLDDNGISISYPHRRVIIDGQHNCADSGAVGMTSRSDRAS